MYLESGGHIHMTGLFADFSQGMITRLRFEKDHSRTHSILSCETSILPLLSKGQDLFHFDVLFEIKLYAEILQVEKWRRFQGTDLHISLLQQDGPSERRHSCRRKSKSKCAVLYTLRSVRLTFNELRLAQCRAKLFDFCQGGSGSDCGDCHSDVSFPRTTSSKALVSFVDEIKVEKNKHRRKEINTGVGKYTRIILPGRLWCVLKSARD